MSLFDKFNYRYYLPHTLKALSSLGGSALRVELIDKTIEIAEISEEELAVVYPDSATVRAGESKIIDVIPWAWSDLRELELVESNNRGLWSITSKGQRFINQFDDESSFEQKLKTLGDAVRAKRAKNRRSTANSEPSLPDTESKWKARLLTELKRLTPDAFERLSMRLIKEAGFRDVEVLGKTGDGGIDGKGVLRFGFVSFPTYFQCKRYDGSVSANAVRDFRGAMAGRGDQGVVITTGRFTQSAKDEAAREGTINLQLVDGDQLCDYLRQYEIGVEVRERTVYDVKVIPEFFEAMS